MPEAPRLEDLSIRPLVVLGSLAALTPTALLLAYQGKGNSIWYGPAAHAILRFSTLLLSILIASWLGQESRRNRHPALAVLTAGFLGMAAISGAAAFVRRPEHTLIVRTLSIVWLLMYGGCAVTLLNWQRLRRYSRQLMLERPLQFYSSLVLLFSGTCLGIIGLDHPVFHSADYTNAIRTSTLVFASATISLLLISTVRLYLRKRNTVILFFSLGLYLYTLSLLGETGGKQWAMLWWFSEGLSLISVFAIAYGILEANRVRDRLELIETLATRSQELQKSHSDLASSEVRYRSLVNNAPYGIFWLNEYHQFESVNPALVELLGYESEQEVTGLFSCANVFKERSDYEGVMQELRKSGRVEEEIFWKKKNGAFCKVRLKCLRVAGEHPEKASYEGLVEDLSAQSSLEEQLRQSQKMEAIGRLAGGIAHDFNNLLTVISGYTGMLMDTLSKSDPRRSDAERVKTAAEKAASLTRQLLAFSRKQVLSPTTLNLNTVIADLSKMLPRLIGEDIDLAFMPGKDLAYISADRSQIEQVLMNLVVNARDAMPSGGKITLETKNEQLDEKYTRQRRGVIPGAYVMLAVTDTGCGMDAATRARIFEPFFTTKEEGKGTGLGLATAYGIVKQSGGHIAVYSEPEQGTTFRVYFPATSLAKKREQESIASKAAARGETIMVVEDEVDLRNMIVRALRRKEYNVLEAGNGEEALQMMQKNGQDVELVITDIVMPGMRGTEAAQKLVSMAPNLKVLYMSGYTDNAMFHQKLLDTGTLFIQKPFTLDVLEDKVAKALKVKTKAATAGNGQ